jgi:hypothetical protein
MNHVALQVREELKEAEQRRAAAVRAAGIAAAEYDAAPSVAAKTRRDNRASELEVLERHVAQLQKRWEAWEAKGPERQRIEAMRGQDQSEIDAAWAMMKQGLEMIEQGHEKLTALKNKVANLNSEHRNVGGTGTFQLNLPVDHGWRRRAERLVRTYDSLVYPLM